MEKVTGNELIEDIQEVHYEDQPTGKIFTVEEVDLPKGYFRSIYFWGSMIAIGLSLMCGVAGFSLIAPILTFVNDDIGPSPYLTWVALTYTLTGAIGLMIVGRLTGVLLTRGLDTVHTDYSVTDIFGRRWFFIVGSAIALLGSIVCAVAPNIPAMIAGETLIGLGSSAQLSFAFASGELVPMKYRFLAHGFCYAWLIIPNGFGAIISTAFVYESKVGWRGTFYLLTALNAACTACWYFFYYPPNFSMKHGHGPGRRMQYLRDFDYLGTFLATLGLLLFLMGLSWGGTVHPWKSAHVIATVVIGFILLVAFVLYEVYVPLKEYVASRFSVVTSDKYVDLFCLWGYARTELG